jgi:acyl dehydratase
MTMETREVESAPGMLGLYAKAAGALVPGAGRLPFVPAPKGKDIPDVELVQRDVEIDRDRLVEYSKVCGFTLRDTLPGTYPHVLAFPLHMALMTDSGMPFGAVGLVHISNRITQLRPIGADERLTLKVSATKLEPHPKGRKFSVLTKALVGDEPVWEGSSTTLRRGGGGEGGDGEGAERKQPGKRVRRELPATAEWKLAGDLGRKYAGVSGDRNPIHLYDVTAKLFGFPRAIAHGMWTKARCLAAIEKDLPEGYTIEVDFLRPILLPATVSFGSAREQGGLAFSVRDAKKGTPHLAGAVVGD